MTLPPCSIARCGRTLVLVFSGVAAPDIVDAQQCVPRSWVHWGNNFGDLNPVPVAPEDSVTLDFGQPNEEHERWSQGANYPFNDWADLDSLKSARIEVFIHTGRKETETIEIRGLGEVTVGFEGTYLQEADLIEAFGNQRLLDTLEAYQGKLTIINTSSDKLKWVEIKVHFPDNFCNAVVVKEPEEDDLLIAGRNAKIHWINRSADSLIIQFADMAKGGAFDLTVDTVAAGSGEYTWLVPDTLTRKAVVRPVDLNNPGSQDTSDEFKIKGYVLTRIDDNDNYEAFDPSKHGWSFENRESLLSPPVYQNTSQFNYNTGGSDPFTGDRYDEALFATRPNNYAEPPRFEDWPSVVRAFGVDDMYLGSPADGRYSPAAVRRWLHRISGEWWGGSCSGMSVWALMAFAEKDRFGGLYPQIGVVDELNSVVTGFMPDYVRETINELFTYWNSKKPQDHIQDNFNNDPRTTLSDLKEILLDETESHPFLGYIHVDNSTDPVWAHAVVPYKLTRTSTMPNRWDLSIYNPNEPGRVEIIKIDSSANSWSYAPDYDGSGDFFVMDPIENHFPDAVYKTSSNRPMGQAPAAKGLTPGDTIKVYPNAWAHVDISGETGSIGYADSAAFNTIADAYLSINPTGYASSPGWYRVPFGSYNVTLSHLPGAASVLSIEHRNTSLTYARYDASSEQTDHIIYDGGLGTANHDPESKTIFLDWIHEFEGQARIVEIENLVLDEGDSVYVDAETDEVLHLENFGSEGTYDLILTRGGPDTVVVFGSIGVPIGAGARHRIPPDWENLDTEPVEIEVDADGDGTYEGSMKVRNNVSVEDLGIRSDELPTRFALHQNYPNPFNPSTTIRYDLPTAADVRLTIFDALGRRIESLVTSRQSLGSYSVTWDAAGVPSGVYFYRLVDGEKVLTRSMLLAK